MYNFRPDTRGRRWSLTRLTCSAVRWGRRSSAREHHWRAWGVRAVSGPHWVCPAHGMCAFPVYTAQAPGCSAAGLKQALCCVHSPGLSRSGSGSRGLHKGADSVGHAFCALSRSEQLRHQVLVERTVPGGPCVSSPPWSQALGFPDAP